MWNIVRNFPTAYNTDDSHGNSSRALQYFEGK